MTITKTLEDNTLTVALTGRLDTNTAPELENELVDDLAVIDKLVLDFKDLDYISSAGLRILLSAHKQMAAKGGMTVKNVNATIQDIFDITGFVDILTIE